MKNSENTETFGVSFDTKHGKVWSMNRGAMIVTETLLDEHKITALNF